LAEVAGHTADEIVSSEAEALILVDQHDRVVGQLSKAACHDGDGVLHRAFSLFIFNQRGELLMQRRSGDKRLWPLFWSNSCCSHPRHGESMNEAIHRRLHQELRMASELHFLYKFQYQVRFQEIGSENELCSVFVGSSDDHADPNGYEIADHRWIAPDHLDVEMKSTPEAFTPWFQMEWLRVRKRFRDTLNL